MADAMGDPYRYFRIEARELTSAISSGLAELARGAPAAGHVGLLLRHAHTLKGAARVVSASTIADLAHAFEELLEPYRHSEQPIPDDVVALMLIAVDGISAQLATLDQGAPAQSADRADSANTIAAAALSVPAQQIPGAGQTLLAEPVLAMAQASLQPAGAVLDEPLDQTARVWLSEIDDVIDGVGQALRQVRALLACSAQLSDLRSRLAEPPAPRPGGLMEKIAGLQRDTEEVQRTIGACAERIDRELRDVHDVAERLRLVPVETIAQDLERAARDVATEQGKRVRIDLTGGQIRLDAPVLAAAQVALRQIVRNAVAHGIEVPPDRIAAGKPAEGRLQVHVTQSGNELVFRCQDDGRGIDVDAVRRQLRQAGADDLDIANDERVLELLMQGGVSTAPVLSEISGRGIGLDVVRDAAGRLGGRLRISTRPGNGTTIELMASGALSAQQVLLVEAGTMVALPLSAVRTTARVQAGDISRGPAGETLVHDGQTLAFQPLAALLGNSEISSTAEAAWTILILHSSGAAAAVGVTRLIDATDIAIRPLPRLAPAARVISGWWLDADGLPQLVLDPAVVIESAGAHRALDPVASSVLAPILVVDDSLTTRMLEQSILAAAGYQVELAASAEEGLRMASSRPYSLVLVDVEMPGMDGFAFIEQTRARAELRHLPCILVTTRSSPQDRQRGIDAGAAGHIDKGEFHQGHLLTRIAQLLSN